MLRAHVLAVLALALSSTSCGAPPFDGCLVDADCSDGFRCNGGGACVQNAPGGEGEGEGEGEPGEGEGEQQCPVNGNVCDNDRVCVGGFCDKENDLDGIPPPDDPLGCCVRILCLSDADCIGGETCDIEAGVCTAPLVCDSEAEPADSGCAEGETCVVGANFEICAVVIANECTVGPPAAVTSTGALRFTVSSNLTATWETSAGTISPDGVLTPAACATGVCDVVVTATASAATCTSAVRVLAPAAGGTSRAVVVDRDGLPLSGVDVTGVSNAVRTTEVTDEDGVVVFAGALDAVSAFPEDHNWITVLAPPADALLVVNAERAGEVSGARGQVDFSQSSAQGDIGFAVSGAALQDVTALGGLLGFPADVLVDLEGITEPGGNIVTMSSGAVVMLGADAIKGDWINVGEPGRNAVWSIAQRMPLAEAGPIFSVVAAGDSTADVAASLLMSSARLINHDVRVGDTLTLSERPLSNAAPYEEWLLAEYTLSPQRFTSTSTTLSVPTLPCVAGGGVSPECSAFREGVLVLRASLVPGVGLVPLGITGARDDFFGEGIADGLVSTDAFDGFITLRSAPPYNGLEGTKRVNVALAMDPSFDGGDHETSVSAVVSRDATLPSFLEQQGGVFIVGSSFTHAAVGDAALYRVVLDDGAGRTWSVWFEDPSQSVDVLALHEDGAQAAARASGARVDAFRLDDTLVATPAPSTFDELFSIDGEGGLTRLSDVVTGFSSQRCAAGTLCEVEP